MSGWLRRDHQVLSPNHLAHVVLQPRNENNYRLLEEEVMPLHIAIDGPVAAGKGTVARLVAQRLGVLYVDTGAMYRVTALLAIRNNVPFEDEEKLAEVLQQNQIEMRNPVGEEQDGRLTTVLVNNEDVSWEIRTEAVGQGSSKVAALKKVREHLVSKQQQIAADKDVVMEGRDITYKVLPNANLKIYLTASAETRAKRRHFELQSRGQDVSFEEVYEDLKQRDDRDTTRAVDPLKIVEGAWVLDSSNLTIEEVVDLIVEKAHSVQK
jgi:CMP/dCMP kinase